MITGDAIRTRCFVFAIAFPILCESAFAVAGREPRAHLMVPTGTGLVSTNPLFSTAPVRHSCSKSSVKRAASSCESATATTFSCCVHESSVQFIEPVQTEARSRTTNLWCIRSGTPAIGRTGTPRDSIRIPSGSGGGGTGIGLR